MASVTVGLTNAQLKKLAKNVPIQLKHKDLVDFTNKHQVNLDVSPEFEKHVKKAIQTGKGIRLGKGEKHVHGGAIIKTALKTTKSVPISFVRSTMGGNAVAKSLKNLEKKLGVKKDLGKVTDTVVNPMGGDLIDIIGKTVKKMGTKIAKPYEAIGVNPFSLGYDLGHDVIAPELQKAMDKKGKGLQLKGKRPVKGSQEARDKMAHLRAMRKKGGSFKSPSGGSFKPPTGGSFSAPQGSGISEKKGPIKLKKGNGFLIM